MLEYYPAACRFKCFLECWNQFNYLAMSEVAADLGVLNYHVASGVHDIESFFPAIRIGGRLDLLMSYYYLRKRGRKGSSKFMDWFLSCWKTGATRRRCNGVE